LTNYDPAHGVTSGPIGYVASPKPSDVPTREDVAIGPDMLPFSKPEAPPCLVCGEPAEWQLGNYRMFKSRAFFWCDQHVPDWVRRAFAEQESREK
jgi:hypothetical protein